MNRRENALRVYRHEQPEYLPREDDYYKMVFPGDRTSAPSEGPDWFGVKWKRVPGMGQVVDHHAPSIMNDITLWREQVKFPDLESVDLAAVANAQLVGLDRENQASTVVICSGHFERLHHLMNFEDALIAFYEEPESLHEFFDAITEYKLKCVEYTKKYFAPDILIFHDDWGTNLNMFFSPELWREFIKPGLKRVIDRTHELGMFFEMHSCGHIMPVMGDLVDDLKVDAIQHFQYPANDIRATKKNWGDRLVVHGGFDAQLMCRPGVTEEEVRRATRETLEVLAPGGNFVPGAPIVGENAAEINRIFEDEIDRYIAEHRT